MIAVVQDEQCVVGHAPTTLCVQIAGLLVATDAEFRRVARMANKSESAFRRHSALLTAARDRRDRVRAERDAHIAECPAALARFSKT